MSYYLLVPFESDIPMWEAGNRAISENNADVTPDQVWNAMVGAVASRMAPVQGYPRGIPWPLHLEAYDAYCKAHGPQRALIEGGCRGGFGTCELDRFVPGWRDRVSEVPQLRAKVTELESTVARLQAALQAAQGEGSMPPT